MSLLLNIINQRFLLRWFARILAGRTLRLTFFGEEMSSHPSSSDWKLPIIKTDTVSRAKVCSVIDTSSQAIESMAYSKSAGSWRSRESSCLNEINSRANSSQVTPAFCWWGSLVNEVTFWVASKVCCLSMDVGFTVSGTDRQTDGLGLTEIFFEILMNYV